jgi:hypothetical protein
MEKGSDVIPGSTEQKEELAQWRTGGEENNTQTE